MEEAFVYRDGGKAPDARTHAPAPAAEAREEKGQGGNPVGRVPLTIRFRSDFAAALKRASLQRQLDGVSPNTLQDILEEAVEPWLRQHGYLN